MRFSILNRSEKTKEQRVQKTVFRTSSGADSVKIEYLYKNRKTDGKPRPTILFLNGILLRLSQWAPQLWAFPDYNLLAINNRGHGKSEIGNSIPKTYLADCARDTKELMDFLRITNPHVVAFSMGSLIATELYHMTGGDFRTMTFVSTPTCNPLLTFPLESAEDILRHEFFVRTFYRSLKLVKNPASLVVLYAYFKLLTGSGVPYKTFSTYLGKALETNFDSAMLSLNAMIEQGDNIEARMRGITAPTMVIVGEKDVIVKPDFERIKAAMPLHAEMIVFPKSTHFPNAEKLKEFNECLLAFLSRHDGINPFAVA